MSQVKRSALIPFSAQQIYDLVNDVNAYADFLPWCANSRILQQTPTSMTATLTIQKGKFRQTFTTQNRLKAADSIIMQLIKGPFNQFHGEWYFIALDEHACKVTFMLDFSFNSKLLSLSLGPLVRNMANTMITAFAERAKEIYHEN